MSETEGDLPAAEYVLGTLTMAERAAVERSMQTDAATRAEVRRWEAWLAGLNDAIDAIEPPAAIWPAIARRIDPPVGSAPPADATLPLRRSRARWRVAAGAFAALAAGLAIVTVQRREAAPAAYLAVVDRGGTLPALIVHVDTANATVRVRSLAAESPPDRTLQLWYIGDGAAPRSMGLVGAPVTLPPDPGNLAAATLAVSVEPPGGSPTGAPTGPVVYSGKLIRDE